MAVLEPNRQKIVDVLERHGLNPNDIVEDGFSSYGYRTIVYGPDGKPQMSAGYEIYTELHPWPDDTVYDELKEAWFTSGNSGLRDRAVCAVQKFLHINYPCDCEPDDQTCDAEWSEAAEIIEILQRCGVKF